MAAHWQEHDGTIHCEAAGGADYTLCGAALEGENGDQPMVQTYARIDCGQCIGIVAFCLQIRKSEFVSTKREVR